jgi:hypothetical protein
MLNSAKRKIMDWLYSKKARLGGKIYIDSHKLVPSAERIEDF